MNMDEKAKIIIGYVDATKTLDYKEVVKFFTPDAMLNSALFKDTSIYEFYRNFFKDVIKVNSRVKDIYNSVTNANSSSAHIYLEWHLINGTIVQFDSMKIFEFNDDNKLIQKLTTMYDTTLPRDAFIDNDILSSFAVLD